MDKRQKSNKHRANNKNAVNAKRPTLSLQKRNELNTLAAKLLEIGFKQGIHPKEEWQQFLDMQKLLARVMELEAPLKRKSTNTTAAARLANIDALYKWANENDIKYDGLKIAQFPGYDLGLEATHDIAKHDHLITIPRKAILTEENLDMDFRQTQFDTMSNLKLGYALMLETLKPDSFWKPYIDMLPDEYSTVLYYSVEDMEQLRGSNVLSHALLLCKSIARQYAFIYNISQSQQNKITELGRSFRESFSYELYRWAVSTVMTRENMIPRLNTHYEWESSEATANGDAKLQSDVVTALIPFWDMANHKHGEITSYFNMETQQMASVAQFDCKKGEQVFIHYGDRSNADLMVHNGFINPTNPKDTVAIKLGLSSSEPLFEKRAQLLHMLEIAKHGELLLLPAPEYVSAKLLGFVRVFNMQEEQLDHWIESERATDLLHIDCALETSLESKAWQFLQTRLMLLLRVFPTTLEEDEAKLAQVHKGELKLSHIGAMTLEYRVLEKRILLNALDYAKQRTKA